MEGCISAGFNRIGGIDVTSTMVTGCCDNINVELKIYKLDILTNKVSSINTTTSRINSNIKVSFGLVCTVSLSDSGEQMWWCKDWQVLWINGLPTLWKGQ